MSSAVENPRPGIKVILDLDNSFKWGPPSVGTIVALVSRRYNVPEVGDLILPDSPHYNRGVKGFLDRHVDTRWHVWRKPKESAVKFTEGLRVLAERNGREIEIDVGSGRKPHLHKITYDRLKGLHPPEGAPRTVELLNNVFLNPGVKSPRFKGHLGRKATNEGYVTVYVEDDPQAAETEAEHCNLVYLLSHWYNIPTWRSLLWWGRRSRGKLPENIVRVRSFSHAMRDFETRLDDGRL